MAVTFVTELLQGSHRPSRTTSTTLKIKLASNDSLNFLSISLEVGCQSAQ